MRLAFTPTAEQLEEYGLAVAAGVDPEVARTEIWPAPPTFNTVLSLIDQDKLTPLVIGWTTCGKCEKHVKHCRCKFGPVEPEYIAKWRAASDVPPVPAVSTPVQRVQVDESYLADLEEDDRNNHPEAYSEGEDFEVMGNG